MMPEDGIADDLRHRGIASLRQIPQDLRAGRGMIDRLLRSVQASLKSRVVLSQIVQKAGDGGCPVKTEGTRPVSRQSCDGDQVFP
jgi:hypothetical protein